MKTWAAVVVAAGLISPARAQYTQQGGKLVGTGAVARLGPCLSGTGTPMGGGQGGWVGVSSDGNTLVTGANVDPPQGAAWVFARSNGVWSQQGAKLVGTGTVGTSTAGVARISGDGNTIIVGGPNDNLSVGNAGAAWIFTRSNGVWSQQGNKLVPRDSPSGAHFGFWTAISGDGNTAIIGGPTDNNSNLSLNGAAWIFTRTNGVWSQQGDQLVGSGVEGPFLGAFGSSQGTSVGSTE